MGTQRILILKGKAGLGNRLLSVLGSILYCQTYDRLLCVDWTDGAYAAKGIEAFGRSFTCNVPLIPLGEVDENSDIFPPIWKHRICRSVREMIDEHDPKYWDNEDAVFSRYSIRFQHRCPAHHVVLRWSYHDDINEFFPLLGMKLFTEAKRYRALQETMQKHVAIEETLRKEFEQISPEFLSGETIGIHVRYTDNRNPLQVQLAQLERLAKKHSQATIFVATDSEMVESKLRAIYPGRIVTTHKSLSASGSPLHRQGLGDEARRSALLDLYLLSKCDYLVYSARSTFGYCAALMSQLPEESRFDCLNRWQRVKRTLNSMKWNLKQWTFSEHSVVGVSPPSFRPTNS